MSISGRLAPRGNGNDRNERSVLWMLSSTAATWPALLVPRDEFSTKVDGGGRRPSAVVISFSRALRSS